MSEQKAKTRQVSRRVKFLILADPSALGPVRAAVEKLAEEIGFSEADGGGIALAHDEALANVIKHGYGGSCAKPIEILMQEIHEANEQKGIEVVIRDQGRQVDPEVIQGRDLDDVRPGGLGTHIIRHIMDEVHYEKASKGGMRLRMRKYLSKKK